MLHKYAVGQKVKIRYKPPIQPGFMKFVGTETTVKEHLLDTLAVWHFNEPQYILDTQLADGGWLMATESVLLPIDDGCTKMLEELTKLPEVV